MWLTTATAIRSKPFTSSVKHLTRGRNVVARRKLRLLVYAIAVARRAKPVCRVQEARHCMWASWADGSSEQGGNRRTYALLSIAPPHVHGDCCTYALLNIAAPHLLQVFTKAPCSRQCACCQVRRRASGRRPSRDSGHSRTQAAFHSRHSGRAARENRHRSMVT